MSPHGQPALQKKVTAAPTLSPHGWVERSCPVVMLLQPPMGPAILKEAKLNDLLAAARAEKCRKPKIPTLAYQIDLPRGDHLRQFAAMYEAQRFRLTPEPCANPRPHCP